MNREFTRLFGHTPQESIGRHLNALIVPDESREEKQRYADRVAQGERVDVEEIAQRKDGRRLQVSMLRVPVSVPGGQVEIYAIYRDITERTRVEREKAHLFEQLQGAHAQLQALSRRLLDVQEAERRHLARELHDEIGQSLTGLKLLLDMSTRLPAETVKRRLSEAQTLVSDLMDRVNELSLNLRPELLDELGLLPSLLGHFERYTVQTDIQVTFRQNGLEGRRFGPEIETTVYRLIQEALTNVARHAGVREVTVQLWVGPDLLGVEIEDHGVGFEPQAMGVATGLSGMRERVSLLGGQLSIESSPGSGTHITAELPLTTPGERSDIDDDHPTGG